MLTPQDVRSVQFEKNLRGYRTEDVDRFLDKVEQQLGQDAEQMEALRKQVADLIKNRLISENLINDPLIFVDILNIKITVMGEVKSPQVLQVEDSRITLLEAITRTGGVTTNALLDRVAVIREEGNERKMYMHDIRSSDIFYSPCYYLQQNDMVYIHPKFAEANTKERRTLGFYSFGVTLLSLITTLTVLLK